MYAVLIVLFGLLNIADGVVTYFGLSLFGLEEVNPMLNYCADSLGLGCSITVLKLAILCFIAFLFDNRRRMKSPWIAATLSSAVVFYGWVVANNLMLVIEA